MAWYYLSSFTCPLKLWLNSRRIVSTPFFSFVRESWLHLQEDYIDSTIFFQARSSTPLPRGLYLLLYALFEGVLAPAFHWWGLVSWSTLSCYPFLHVTYESYLCWAGCPSPPTIVLESRSGVKLDTAPRGPSPKQALQYSRGPSPLRRHFDTGSCRVFYPHTSIHVWCLYEGFSFDL